MLGLTSLQVKTSDSKKKQKILKPKIYFDDMEKNAE